VKVSEQSDRLLKTKEKNHIDLIEAALYAAGRPLDLGALSSLINVKSSATVKSLAEQLMKRYEETNGALELLRLQDGRYVMQLRTDLAQGVMKLVTKRLLTRGPLKTLSFIAIKQPVTQAYVVKVRGNLAYSHVRSLRDKGLISEERLGRTKILKTTSVFADYFNLSNDPRLMKNQLQKIFEKQTKSIEQYRSTPETISRGADADREKI
jgi:segregation and condensation protein B